MFHLHTMHVPTGSKEKHCGSKENQTKETRYKPCLLKIGSVEPSGQEQRELRQKWSGWKEGQRPIGIGWERFEKPRNLGRSREKVMSGSWRHSVSFCRSYVVSLKGVRREQEYKQSCKHISTLAGVQPRNQHWLITCQDFGLKPGAEVLMEQCKAEGLASPSRRLTHM